MLVISDFKHFIETNKNWQIKKTKRFLSYQHMLILDVCHQQTDFEQNLDFGEITKN